MVQVPDIGKGWEERTGNRPDGFSKWIRDLGKQPPFLNATRHCDDDLNDQGWRFACWDCWRSFVLIEEKFRPPSNRKPLSEREWRITRNDAKDSKKPVVAVGWWNGMDDSSWAPSEMWVEIWRPPDYEFGPQVMLVEKFAKVLVRLLEIHRETCPAADPNI